MASSNDPVRIGNDRAVVEEDSFAWDAHVRQLTDFTGDTGSGSGGLWTASPDSQWQQNPAGSAAAYLTSPLSTDRTVIGVGAVHVWVRSSTPSVDV